MTTYETEDGTLLDPGDVVDKARALDMMTKARAEAEAKGYKRGLVEAAEAAESMSMEDDNSLGGLRWEAPSRAALKALAARLRHMAGE